MTVGKAYPKAGWRSSDTHPLFFDGVRVPADALLSEPGRGYRDVLEFLTWARLPIAAMSAGLARGCLHDTLRFVTGRQSFGRPLGAHQGVAFQVAQIAALASTARTMTYDGAWKSGGRRLSRAATSSMKALVVAGTSFRMRESASPREPISTSSGRQSPQQTT